VKISLEPYRRMIHTWNISVKEHAWTKVTDHGGLRHASEDTYRFFLALETRVYELIKRGEQKEKMLYRSILDYF